jgi:prepilin peptidase CpaA
MMTLAVALAACAFDLRTRRIPNLLTLGGAAAALVYWGSVDGFTGLGVSAAGWGVGLAVFLPLFLLGGLGAGDVKLLACLGAWLGPSQALWTALYGAIAGGVFAIVVAFATGYLRTAVGNVYLLLAHFRVSGVRPHPELTLERGKGPRLPYALPIMVGAIAAMWLD